jgi:Uma2 family endonuclease
MNIQLRPKRITFDEFCELVKDGEKADLIDGVVYMASPDNLEANSLFVWLITLIHNFIELKDLGAKTFGSQVAFRLGKYASPEPDIGVVLSDRLNLLHRGYVDGPPDLALEIVSPESVDRDFKKKRKLYQSAGVREYWIVDEIENEVSLLQLGASKRFRRVRPRQGRLDSKVLPGFYLQADWLFQQPRPRIMDVLNIMVND